MGAAAHPSPPLFSCPLTPNDEAGEGRHIGYQHNYHAYHAGQRDRMVKDVGQDDALGVEPAGRSRGDDDALHLDHLVHDTDVGRSHQHG